MANLSLCWFIMSLSSALVVSYFCLDQAIIGIKSLIIAGVLFLYSLYYMKFRRFFYAYIPENPGIMFRGKMIPAHPNGWFVISTTEELKPMYVKAVNQSGHNIVLFRGEDGVAYALDAFCPHSGANLGVGGAVKHMSCVQCPFHGWLFDGKTGNLVAGNTLTPRKVEFYTYNEKVGTCKLDPQEILKKTGEGLVNLRKYLLKEQNGYIYAWLHADPKTKPNYEPLDFTETEKRLVYKGVSLNRIFSHCQDVPENGGDIRHFIYVHSYLLPFTTLLGAKWDAKWCRGDDPELKQKMKHKIPWVDDHKQKLLDKYLTKENSSSIGIMSLDMSSVIGGLAPKFFFNATVFQVGPGLVYLFLISPYYEVLFFQHTTSKGKFEHDVFHELYASWYLPHWVTALILRLEAMQVTNDTYVWNKKVFATNPMYATDGEADMTILTWRRWFGQFYEGCAKREEDRDKLTW
ncbi:hypothetical protein SteCoe_15091 [Stentor coeruleus]|uniref:cholesterol 7-desaturase n=1 Tax=Stentor coeruleus TaxID=5963 RepID=A0A1R2C4D0_9CILI|nr:hypothetical protein SteCoe_15091 [Stentor coeruleus]